ncbi:MAG TPA: GAF domain-containing protein, partial [Gaiellaceae bacterium]
MGSAAMPAGSSARERAGRALLDEGIARLALLALAERDVQRLLERAVVLIAEVLAVEHVQLFELLPDGSTLVSRASVSGERRMLTRLKLERPADSQASFTLHERAPVIVNDFRRETRFSPSRTQRALEIRTAVSIPLFGRGARPYGVLEIGSRGRLSPPAEAVADFLQGAGHLVVPAVERARVEAACRFLAESESRIVSAQGFP